MMLCLRGRKLTLVAFLPPCCSYYDISEIRVVALPAPLYGPQQMGSYGNGAMAPLEPRAHLPRARAEEENGGVAEAQVLKYAYDEAGG